MKRNRVVTRFEVNMVGIAQSVERLVVVQKVAGSNPVTHPDIEVRTIVC